MNTLGTESEGRQQVSQAPNPGDIDHSAVISRRLRPRTERSTKGARGRRRHYPEKMPIFHEPILFSVTAI